MTAPTFVAASSVPEDGGSAANAGPTITLPTTSGALASAQAGDLIVVWVQYSDVADTSTFGQVLPDEYGGQNWNIERGYTGNSHHSRPIWCRFSGAWTASPSFSHFVQGVVSGTLALTAVAVVYRPDAPSKHWVVCNGLLRGEFTAGSSPFTKTITGLTPRKNDTVTMAAWTTADDNTWGSLSGTNWTQSGLSAQYRNTTGSDQSLALAYQLQGTAAATNNVSLNQATLGGDAGGTQIITFAAVSMPFGTNVTTVANVQADRTFDSAGGATSVAVLGTAVTSGNAVIVNWNHETTAGAEVVSILDDQSNEYIQLGRHNDFIFEQTKIIAWRPAITNGPTTITATLSTSEIFRHIYAREVAGLGRFDLAVGYVQTCPDAFAPWNPFTPSRTPSVNGCFLSGQAFIDGGVAAGNPSAADDADGWTLGFGGISGSPDEPNVEHYQIQTTAAADDYDIDIPTSIGATGVVMGWAAFRPASSAGPTLSGASGTGTGHTSGTISVTTNDDTGTLYGVVTSSATQPSVAQIKAAQDHTGAAAAWGGSTAISSTGAKQLSATGLTAGAGYYAHFVHANQEGVDSARASSAQWFTTAAGTGPRIYPFSLGSAPIGLFVLGSTGGGGGTTQTLTTSLSAAVQQAQAATAALGVAVQAPQTASTIVDAAVAAPQTASASIDAALALARSATASVDTAVHAVRSAATSADLAVQAARSAAASADVAVQQVLGDATSIDAYVQASTQLAVSIDLLVQAGSSLSAAVDLAVQAARSATTNVDLAVQLARGAAASIDTAVQQARTATAVVDIALQAARSAGVSVDLFVQAGFALAASIDTAVQKALSATASISTAVATARSAVFDVSTVVSVQRVITSAIEAAVRATASASASVSLYVEDPSAAIHGAARKNPAPPAKTRPPAPGRGLTRTNTATLRRR